MKKLKRLVAGLLILTPMPCFAAYLDTIVANPAHPYLSASMLYTSKLVLDGGVTDVALVWHVADPKDSLWPQKWIDAGVPALSWTLLECGAGGNTSSGFAECGASLDAAPTILGPLVSALNKAGGKYATVASLIANPNGNGVKLGVSWKANLLENGGVPQFDKIRAPVRYKVGYNYLWGS